MRIEDSRESNFDDGRLGDEATEVGGESAGEPDAEVVWPALVRRALVVDDDLLIRCMLADELQRFGFSVRCAANGKLGLEQLFAMMLELDVLVTDLRMPGMDGEALTRLLRSGGERDLAILLVTSGVTPELRRKLLLAGASEVLDKGAGPEVIASAAHALTRKAA